MKRKFKPPTSRFTAPTAKAAPARPSARRPLASGNAAVADDVDEMEAPEHRAAGEWEVLFAKKGRKKRPTWMDGVVTREAAVGPFLSFRGSFEKAPTG